MIGKLEQSVICDWVVGDLTGLEFPAHIEALIAAGPAFLTSAFRNGGALASNNAVKRITSAHELAVGGTGRKLLLSVEYEAADTLAPPTELFVKFSRHFHDSVRDAARYHMEAEVRLAELSRHPAFPIVVPECLFADFHHETGTGMLITERIHFGTGGIEGQLTKCRDFELDNSLDHYEALMKALARLAGVHKAGGLGTAVEERFPLDVPKLSASNCIRYTKEQLARRFSHLKTFIEKYPRLFPSHIREKKFIGQIEREAQILRERQPLIEEFFHSNQDLIALCHYNAHIDNAWYWRTADGRLECGLLDWGSVGQMPFAATLWGCLSGAEVELWDDHLEHLLTIFADEFRASGGERLEIGQLKAQLELKAIMMGLAWVMDAPLLITREIPSLRIDSDRFDPVFVTNETSRVQLHSLVLFLHVWKKADPVGVLSYLIRSN